MNAKHTPGPWIILNDKIVGTWIKNTDRCEAGLVIATVENPIHYLEVQANARLIAAAPELLEISRKINMEINGLHCSKKAISRDYAQSILCKFMDNLIRDNAIVFNKATRGES